MKVDSRFKEHVKEERYLFFYVWVSVHHKSILYKEPTRCNFGSIARSLYMFRTLSASIIRSTKSCSNSHWCMSWVGIMYIQQGRPRSVVCCTQDHSTRFGRFLRPSSGVLKAVVTATGACHGSGWCVSSKDVQGRLSAAAGRPYWIHIIPTHDMHQWLLLELLVLLMIDRKSVV